MTTTTTISVLIVRDCFYISIMMIDIMIYGINSTSNGWCNFCRPFFGSCWRESKVNQKDMNKNEKYIHTYTERNKQ